VRGQEDHPVRRRLPWVLYGIVLLLLAVTLWFTFLNGSFEIFVAIAVMMMIGYGTVGALIASRVRGNPLGWIMLVIAVGFVLTGLTDEFLRYHAAETAPEPLVLLAAWITNWVFLLVLPPIPLLILLFPTGRLQSERWRPFPIALIALSALGALTTIVRPGFVENDQARVVNPTGIQALEAVTSVADIVVWLGLLVCGFASVVSVILRFRAASGDERQQIRWLTYAAGTAIVLLVGAIITGLSFGEVLISEVFWLALFACIGVAFPIAIGTAIMKYRLYDLDIVVKKTVVAFILVGVITALAFLLAVAVPVAIVGIGPDITSIVPIAIGIAIGIGVSPLRTRARHLADRIVYGGRATPYEVLSEFAERMGGTYSAEDVLPRMAQLLAQGTGANETTVWLHVGNELRPVGHWPANTAEPVEPEADAASFSVEHRGEQLGVLTLRMPANDPMDPTKERLVRDVAGQASLVLRNVLLIEDLRESRRRIVSVQDERARTLERNIHDGAQQQLVALAVKARLARQLAPRDPANTQAMLRQIEAETQQALEDLRDLARGIYPPLLADKGLAAAIEAQARKSPLPVSVEPDGVGRYSQDVESTVYFCCLEALTNVAKYADASAVTIRLAHEDGELRFEVTDDGRGFDTSVVGHGTGLQGMADRLDAIGGRLEVRSAVGEGTTIAGRIEAQAEVAAAQASSSRSGPNAALGM
jgi:signal transduction histidine kinase